MCRITISVLFIAFCLLKCSTDKTPEPATHMEVLFTLNWDQALAGGQAPQALRYCFYPQNGGPMIQVEGTAEGLKFMLPKDKYSVLIFNSDADNVMFRHMDSFDTAEAYLPGTKAGGGVASGKTALFGIAIEELAEITTGEEPIAQDFVPVRLVREISLDINVDGMEYVASCKGSLSGIPVALNLSKQIIVSDQTTSVNFEATPSEQGVKANVSVLGTAPKPGVTPPTAPPVNEVKLDFTLNDGSTASTQIDLGDSIQGTEGNEVNVDISVTVEKSASFSVTVNKWEVSPGDDMVIE